MPMFGKIVHISADLLLVSACLAGIRRNTGLTPKLESIEDPTIRKYFGKYLNYGESIYDYTVATCGSSSYFSRK
ncbi:hypothetical protein TBLA_0I01710 [Henningerozyma blattae CBS 6284]|uniref:DUF1748-domain-containing protein n=1 Tax=Henningerozyma blattae (strain ATCC 34711 / CBS 6284 / DSM 70876 / NBRC 10599 / NRRL Y-10934 / UCD 77-7) TaxID=1071380 RepID=I2H8X7_HENB6|nr:hypothetical protein TBLA_0I01710 [Tetrapisispora blattae CBS 6284]CCH62829.1 hypothetical protein TBLA_0I01710 [Tetrapisispora blattae CBS 6284]